MTKEELYGGKKEKPRICEVLGVEVNEEWVLNDPIYGAIINRINADGDRETKDNGEWGIAGWELMLVEAINHPEKIKRLPHWTAEDIEDAKAVKRLYPEIVSVSRNAKGTVSLTDAEHLLWMNWKESERFPALKPGRTVTIDEILEAENNDR